MALHFTLYTEFPTQKVQNQCHNTLGDDFKVILCTRVSGYVDFSRESEGNTSCSFLLNNKHRFTGVVAKRPYSSSAVAAMELARKESRSMLFRIVDRFGKSSLSSKVTNK